MSSSAHAHTSRTPSSGSNTAAAQAPGAVQLKPVLAGQGFEAQEAAMAPRSVQRAPAGGTAAVGQGPLGVVQRASGAAPVQRDETPGRGGGSTRARRPVAPGAQTGAQTTPGAQAGATETMDFEGETVQGQVYVLGGRSAYDVVQDYVNGMATALQQMKDGELGAIQSFMGRMQFSSSSQASPDVLGTIFKSVGKTLWDHAISEVATSLGSVSYGGFGLSEAIGLIDAVSSEFERAAAAQQSVSAGNFVEALRSQATATYQGRIVSIITRGPTILSHYQSLEGTEGPNVTGAKAGLLTAMSNATQQLPRRIPAPIAYEAQFMSRFVNNAGGTIIASFDSAEENGAVTFEEDSVTLDGSPNAGHAADALTSLMRQQGKRLWQLGVPVNVRLNGPLVAGGSGYTTYLVGTDGPSPSRGTGFATMDQRWRAFCTQQRLGSVHRITG